MNIGHIRKEYRIGTLIREQLPENPFILFQEWLNKVIESGLEESTAMTLSTIGVDGFPQSRVVLLKSLNSDGFAFFTNYNSEKGKSIEFNNKVGLTFFWPQLQRQVRVKGIVSKVSKEISDEYFATRPVESQIGAWVSNQSEEIFSREELEELYRNFHEKLRESQIPRPKHWGGYKVNPISIEFWQGRENRLHDRFLYEKEKNGWNINRLAP